MLVRGQTEQILSSLIVDLFQSDVSFVSQKSLSLLLEFHHRVSKNKQKKKKERKHPIWSMYSKSCSTLPLLGLTPVTHRQHISRY